MYHSCNGYTFHTVHTYVKIYSILGKRLIIERTNQYPSFLSIMFSFNSIKDTTDIITMYNFQSTVFSGILASPQTISFCTLAVPSGTDTITGVAYEPTFQFFSPIERIISICSQIIRQWFVYHCISRCKWSCVFASLGQRIACNKYI